ncbi:hypothetical protein BGZ49_008265 [Haplosporangium sp. Z 27]|nr:hypothetical protein BGZ49_008265 [Haplosporangium sp. Z 27]
MSATERICEPATQRSHILSQERSNSLSAIEDLSDGLTAHSRISRPPTWTDKALGTPEVVLMIQEQLDRSSLNVSLRVSRLWHYTGHHLVWQTVDWNNTLEDSTQKMMQAHSYRIKTLRCVFHQNSTSNADSALVLRSIIDQPRVNVTQEDEDYTQEFRKENDSAFERNKNITQHYTLNERSIPKKKLQHLILKGRFDLLTATSSSTNPIYLSFYIPTLTRLEIRPSVNTTVDIHLILDSAIQLKHLTICSHGAFVDSKNLEDLPDEIPSNTQETTVNRDKVHHHHLLSITIQHLKISSMELESVAARCPNLIKFQSICSPGTIWKERPIQLQEQQSQQLVQPRSLVQTLAATCPKIERFNVGIQQGGLHLESIREILTCFPRLGSLGLPALDCTKVTMDTIKSIQIENQSLATQQHRPLLPSFLTSLCIINVCSSEKISQVIHDFLCWTPYLKEFHASNTTLYIEQMQNHHATEEVGLSASVPVSGSQQTDCSQMEHHEGGATPSKACQSGGQIEHQVTEGSSHTPVAENNTTPAASRPHQWACTGLEKLVVRFAHLPWRNLSNPPKRSKDAFSFLKPLKNLKYLSIKEGLMLEAGREYDALIELPALEEIVLTTCYPIPIKPVDMHWLDDGNKEINHSTLKKVVVRRQKANVVLDKEMNQWFQEHRPDLKFSFELNDCEEE